MADVEPLNALHYDLEKVGGLQPVAAPPYDVIDPAQRAQLLGQSPFNVVEIDLPSSNGGDPYEHAAAVLSNWNDEGIVVRDSEPALWALAQDYTGPDGRQRTRHGVFARVRVEDYGPGRIRPHERTHPGPKEDRLRLTRATKANLSPIFSLYDDPSNAAWNALAPHLHSAPWGEVTDPDGTVHKLWRIADAQAINAFKDALRDTELLIADGHHRYETARVYQQEQPTADYVLMCLVALQDDGLTVFPTHRLAVDADMDALNAAIERDWTTDPQDTLSIGYYTGGELTTLYLKDWAIADAALEGKPEPYRRLDTAVLEALLLKGALGLSEDDISHLHGLDYARDEAQAREKVDNGEADAAFLMTGTPVDRVRDVAATGENMPPKSTYFFPKVLTGMLFQSPGGPMALINRSTHAVAGALRAVARKRERYTHDVKAGKHTFTVDEPQSQGGQDMGPSPQELLAASLASCTAVTMEMYAERKGWNVDGLEVDCRYTPAERGCPTRFELIMKLPSHLNEEQVERLQVIAAKCPVHRTLEGEVAFEERIELT